MEVKLHTKAKESYAAWARTLSPFRMERRRLAKLYWVDFKRWLVDVGGPPHGSVPDPKAGRDHWWVRFPPDYLALVRFTTRGGILGWFRRRTALVKEINLSPGLHGRVGP